MYFRDSIQIKAHAQKFTFFPYISNKIVNQNTARSSEIHLQENIKCQFVPSEQTRAGCEIPLPMTPS